MKFAYNRLWKKLIDEGMNKADLQRVTGITPKTIAKMGRNETVSLSTLGKICEYFQCDLYEIIEYKCEGR